MIQILTELMDFKPSLLETGDGKGPLKFEGVGQRYDIKNQNGRVYPKRLWEKLKSNQNVMERFLSRKTVGQLGHPSGQADPERISHVITDFWLGENGDVLVKGEITDTPSGKILEGLLKSGITLGISSRGSGSVKRVNDCDEVQEDFQLSSWDWVLEPSTVNAYPKLKEALENLDKKENYMDSREKLAIFEQKANSVLSLKPSEVTEGLRSVIDNIATDLVVNLTKLGTESPELNYLTEDLISQLNDKRKGFKVSLTEAAPPWLKDKEKDKDDKEDEKKDKKEDKKEKKEEAVAMESTTGSADTGFHRSVDHEAEPPAGEGWPINPGDAGVLAGINDGVNEFMSKSRPVIESEDDDEDDEKKEKKAEKKEEAKDKEPDDDEDDVDEEVSQEMARTEALAEIAVKIVSMPEAKENFVGRAFAAAFLMENHTRLTESQAYARIVEKLQDKFREAAKTGKITLSEEDNTELESKYQTALATIEELQTRHRLLSAKVYAEAELDKVGLKSNPEARKIVAEAIRKAATKTSIDEAITSLGSIKGLKVDKLVDRTLLKEDSQPPAKTLEGTVAKLNEAETKKPSKPEGAELGKLLGNNINFSRSK